MRALLPALVLCACAGAAANERPFVLASTAAQEEDDDRVFEVSVGFERAGRSRALATELQYSFEPGLSLQLGWSRRLVRNDEGERETELSLEGRRVLRDPARHVVGVAVEVELQAEREVPAGERRGWRLGGASATLPLSMQWGAKHGFAWLHLTPGLEHRRGDGTRPLLSLAAQWPVARHVELFGEWGAVRRRDAVAQAGVRWWIKHDKIALDVSGGRRRIDGERAPALWITWSVKDLSY
jgi:hypothetical protein